MLPIAVLAGGLATRLGELTRETPKCLLPINGRPFVDWQLELLKRSGYQKVVFCLSYQSNLIQEHLGDGSGLGLDIKYSFDGEKQLGTGGAIKKALPLLGAQFAVIYGDSYLPISYSAVEESFLDNFKQATMTVYENSNKLDKSNVKFESCQLVAYLKENPGPDFQHIDYGLTYFQAAAFDSEEPDTPFDLAQLCTKLCMNGQLAGYEVFDRFYEIGSLQGIKEFSEYKVRSNSDF